MFFFPVHHHLEELAVLLEDLQSIADVVALQYVGLYAHGQDPSHHGGNFTAHPCLGSLKWATVLFFGFLLNHKVATFHFYSYIRFILMDAYMKTCQKELVDSGAIKSSSNPHLYWHNGI